LKSLTTPRFWKAFEELPAVIQDRAKAAYDLWQRDPHNDVLQFKRVHTKREIYSVRIGKDYRALGVMEESEMTWFWIGSHSDYDKLLKSL
jgi:hypothetical protein